MFAHGDATIAMPWYFSGNWSPRYMVIPAAEVVFLSLPVLGASSPFW